MASRGMALAVLAVLAGCLSSDLSRCPGGVTCPEGFACAPLLDQCVRRDRLSACADPELDGLPCSASGELGICQSGACLSGCGDSVVDVSLSEECEGVNFAGARCEDFAPTGSTSNFYAGELACTSGCRFDLSGCTGYCGDGELTSSELCDDDLSLLESCQDAAFHRGAISCSADCTRYADNCSVVSPTAIPGFPSTGEADKIASLDATSSFDITAGSLRGNLFHYNGVGWTRASPGQGAIFDVATAGDKRYALAEGGLLVSERLGPWKLIATSDAEPRRIWAHADVVMTVAPLREQVLRLEDGEWVVAGDLTELGFEGLLVAIWGRGPNDVYVSGYDSANDEGVYFHFDGADWSILSSGFGRIGVDLWGTDDELLALQLVDTSAVARWTGAGWEDRMTGNFNFDSRLEGVSADEFFVRTPLGISYYQRGREYHQPLPSAMGVAVLGPWHAVVGAGSVVSEYRGVGVIDRQTPTGMPVTDLWSADPELAFFVSSDASSNPGSDGFGLFSYADGTSTRLCDNGLAPVAGPLPDCSSYGAPRAIWGRGPTEVYIATGNTLLRYSGDLLTEELVTSHIIDTVHGSAGSIIAIAGVTQPGSESEIHRFDGELGTWQAPIVIDKSETRLRGVHVYSDDLAYLVGSNGRIDRYTDAGWEHDIAPEIPDSYPFSDVVVLAPDDVVAVAFNGIYEFDGDSWTLAEGPGGATLVAQSGPDVVALGGTSWIRRDGVWSRFALPLAGLASACAGHGDHLFVSAGTEVARIDAWVPLSRCDLVETRCANALDDDCDGFVDAEDSECQP